MHLYEAVMCTRLVRETLDCLPLLQPTLQLEQEMTSPHPSLVPPRFEQEIGRTLPPPSSSHPLQRSQREKPNITEHGETQK